MNDQKIKLMKNLKGFIIIAIAIITGAIIISIPIYNKSISSLDHCYKKVYKSVLDYKIKNASSSFNREDAEAEAAKYARRNCLR